MRRWLWFCGLYAASLTAFGALAYGLRLLMH